MGQKEGKAPQNQREKKYLTAEGKKNVRTAQEGSRGLKSFFFFGGTACGYYIGTLFRHLSQHLLECETKPLK